MSTIKFKIMLPTLTDSDVVSRELTVQVGDSVPDVQSLGIADTESAEYSGKQGETAKVALTDIDDAGNRSESSTLETILADTFPPAKPGDLSLVATGEEQDA